MKIAEVKDRSPALLEQLLAIWQSSVEATHLFLTIDEIQKIKAYVPQALTAVHVLIIAESREIL